jgi:hypothetical protein
METTVLAEDRPYQFDSVWEERIDGRLNGRYLLSTQGAGAGSELRTRPRWPSHHLPR